MTLTSIYGSKIDELVNRRMTGGGGGVISGLVNSILASQLQGCGFTSYFLLCMNLILYWTNGYKMDGIAGDVLQHPCLSTLAPYSKGTPFSDVGDAARVATELPITQRAVDAHQCAQTSL